MASIIEAERALRGHRVAVLSGAGISTGSGIPDYRGPNSVPRTPMTYAQFVGQASSRSHYWARNFLGYQFMRERLPNAGHYALADWEAVSTWDTDLDSPLLGVITQNVDTLHQKAGSREVVDLHGRFDSVLCLDCHREYPRAFIQRILGYLNPEFTAEVSDVEIAPDADAVLNETAGFVVPQCPACGGVLKPNVVFFGEAVPPERKQAARSLVASATALLVVGSSLTVHSGLKFVIDAKKKNYPVVVINRGATRGDSAADVLVDAPLSEALPQLGRLLTGRGY